MNQTISMKRLRDELHSTASYVWHIMLHSPKIRKLKFHPFAYEEGRMAKKRERSHVTKRFFETDFSRALVGGGQAW